MGKIFYQDKKKPWKHICITSSNYEKNWFFYIKRTPNNKFMKRPRFHAMINLFLVSFWRDNSKVKIGIGFGKKHKEIIIAGLL